MRGVRGDDREHKFSCVPERWQMAAPRPIPAVPCQHRGSALTDPVATEPTQYRCHLLRRRRREPKIAGGRNAAGPRRRSWPSSPAVAGPLTATIRYGAGFRFEPSQTGFFKLASTIEATIMTKPIKTFAVTGSDSSQAPSRIAVSGFKPTVIAAWVGVIN